MVTSYRDLHYDVLNIGKQEAWMGYETLKSMLDTLKGTEFVSANLLDIKTKRPIAKPYVIRDLGTMRVGIIGMLNEADFPKGTTLLDSTKFSIMPYMEAAKKYIPSLARKVDAVIVLGELSSQNIDTLLKVVPDIDLIISTGATKSAETLAKAGKKTQVIGPGSSGYSGHYVMMDFDNASKENGIAMVGASDQLTDTYEEKNPWFDRLTAFAASPAINAPPPQQKPAGAPSKTSVQPVPVQPQMNKTAPITTAPSTTNKKG